VSYEQSEIRENAGLEDLNSIFNHSHNVHIISEPATEQTYYGLRILGNRGLSELKKCEKESENMVVDTSGPAEGQW
jgi:hypothetical protein